MRRRPAARFGGGSVTCANEKVARRPRSEAVRARLEMILWHIEVLKMCIQKKTISSKSFSTDLTTVRIAFTISAAFTFLSIIFSVAHLGIAPI